MIEALNVYLKIVYCVVMIPLLFGMFFIIIDGLVKFYKWLMAYETGPEPDESKNEAEN